MTTLEKMHILIPVSLNGIRECEETPHRFADPFFQPQAVALHAMPRPLAPSLLHGELVSSTSSDIGSLQHQIAIMQHRWVQNGLLVSAVTRLCLGRGQCCLFFRCSNLKTSQCALSFALDRSKTHSELHTVKCSVFLSANGFVVQV